MVTVTKNNVAIPGALRGIEHVSGVRVLEIVSLLVNVRFISDTDGMIHVSLTLKVKAE